MGRIITYMDNAMLTKVQEMANEVGKPVSQVAAELIEVGYRVKTSNGKSEDVEDVKRKELIENHSEYLLRIMATVSDILRCVHNDKSK